VHVFALLFFTSFFVARNVRINVASFICDTRAFDIVIFISSLCIYDTHVCVYACIVICICVHFVNEMYEKCKYPFVNFL
jgi:hypothetical protein